MKISQAILAALLTAISGLAGERSRGREQLAALRPSDIAYVSFAWIDYTQKRAETEDPGRREITELFRITRPELIRTLLTALQETGKEEWKGASFSGYLPRQYFIGTNGNVVVEGTVYMDRNVSAGKTTSLSGGRLVEDFRHGWSGPFGPNRRYTRLVYDIVAERAPEVVKEYDRAFQQLGGAKGALGLSDSTKAQQPAPADGANAAAEP